MGRFYAVSPIDSNRLPWWARGSDLGPPADHIILRGASESSTRTRRQMRRAVSEIERPSPTGESARVTMSFGVPELPTHAGVEALGVADTALHQAKRRGRDQVATATVRGRSGRRMRRQPGPARLSHLRRMVS